MNETVHRSLRLSLASLIGTALAAQLIVGSTRGDLTVTNFYSFFAVPSNTTAAVMLTGLALRPDRNESPGFVVFRGAVTVYMSVTGLIYAIVLASAATDVGLTEPWIDWVLHVIGPVLILVDWLVDPPGVGLHRTVLGIWLTFPLAFISYTLIRGPIVDWYPYPILNPDNGGYGSVSLWAGVVLIVILGLSWLYYSWANRERHHIT